MSRSLLIGSVALLLLANAVAVRAGTESSAAGCWLGQVGSGAEERRAVLELELGQDGAWRGLFHRLGSAVDTDTLRAIAAGGQDVSFERPDEKGTLRFRGKVSENGDALTGEFTRDPEKIPLRMQRISGPDAAGRALLGNWLGDLQRNGVRMLRLVVRFAEAPCGQVTAVMDSPDQGAKNLPMTSIAVGPDSLHLAMRYIGGRYDAAVSPDAKKLTGKWMQAGATMDLELARTDSIPVQRRPQEPVKPFPYLEEEVTYDNPDQGVKIAGTLTLPQSGGPFPAVLLISGSGAQNRDEMIMGHKPFLVIADHLTRQGVAVLRVDDRGIGGSTGDLLAATLPDNASDALAGVKYLKSRHEIDTGKIGLVGHSEGGWVAPIAATRSRDVAFIILLAGPGVGGEDLLYGQEEAMARAKGASPEMIALNRETAKRVFKILKTQKADSTAERMVVQTVRGAEPKLRAAAHTPADSALAQTWLGGIDQRVKLLTRPWFRYLLTYEPAPVLKQVRVPVLALYGSHDLQVPPAQNVPAMEHALRAGRDRDFTVLELPGLNHLFQNAPTGMIEEYSRIEETFAPSALDLIANWILERTRGSSRTNAQNEYQRGE
jgi:uncharacterized protein